MVYMKRRSHLKALHTCPSSFPKVGGLKKHSIIFVCSMCPSKFAQKSLFTQHMDAVHEKKKPFECSLCPCNFGFKNNLDKHIATVHEKKKPFEWSLCPPKNIE